MSLDYFDKESLDKWFKADGDSSHRLNYDLNENSIVMDLGGYLGEWSQKIYRLYGCNIFIFEPVKKHYNFLKIKFSGYQKINVFNFALSHQDGFVGIAHSGAESSIYSTKCKNEIIRTVKFADFITNLNFSSIDLIKINIEGSEYDLLDHILSEKIECKLKNIQVQFHKMFRDSELRRDQIRAKLSKTHRLTYDYTFVWENWEKSIFSEEYSRQ